MYLHVHAWADKMIMNLLFLFVHRHFRSRKTFAVFNCVFVAVQTYDGEFGDHTWRSETRERERDRITVLLFARWLSSAVASDFSFNFLKGNWLTWTAVVRVTLFPTPLLLFVVIAAYLALGRMLIRKSSDRYYFSDKREFFKRIACCDSSLRKWNNKTHIKHEKSTRSCSLFNPSRATILSRASR